MTSPEVRVTETNKFVKVAFGVAELVPEFPLLPIALQKTSPNCDASLT
jgi:hypothetical protein